MGANPERAMEVLADVVAKPPPEQAEYLAACCGSDTDLRREVQGLLRAHARAEASCPEAVLGERPGDRIGSYVLLERIGAGGFGVVWLAEQSAPLRRQVALKVLKPGMDTAEVVARFETERQTLALMEHPNIARVFDAGATALGRPFFVMELVRGAPLTRYCDEARLSPRERLELFTTVCEAVQHAHQKGVIHRDLKPSNVLVTLHDGRPVPKVIDFGIAKAIHGQLTDKTVLTGFRQMLGTPEYMAPEQANLSGLDVDTRADIYSLGVLAYELLTGTRPFELKEVLQTGYDELLRRIREVVPAKPSTRVSTLGDELLEVARHRHAHPKALGKLFRGDLDWIVLKALEKDRGRRYPTALAMAEDVARHLRHEPVLAGPPSFAYRLRKYLQRHRVGAAASAAVVVSLVAGAAAAAWGYVRAKENEGLAIAAATDAGLREREAKRAAAKAGHVIALLREMLGSSDPRVAKGKDYTVRKLLDDFGRRLTAQLHGEPEVEATLEGVMGRSYLALGLLDEAQTHLARARELHASRSVLGLEATSADVDWAHYLTEVGRYDEALAVLRAAEAALTGHDHDERLLLAESWSDAALILSDRGQPGDLAAAWELQGKALAVQRELLPGTHDTVTASLNNLAYILRRQNRLADAQKTFEEVLERDLQNHGEDSLQVAATHANLGETLMSRGDLARAEQVLRQALEVSRRELGVHLQVAWCANNLGLTLKLRGDHEGAADLLSDALDLRQRLLGDHPSVVHTLQNLAATLCDQGKRGEALLRQQEALAMCRRLHPSDHGELAVCLMGMAHVHLKGRELAPAAEHFQQAAEMLRRIQSEPDPTYALARRGEAEVRVAQGELAEAAPILREVIAVLRRFPDHDPYELARALLFLGRVHLDLGAPTDAVPCLQEALQLFQPLVGESHVSVIATNELLGRARSAAGDLAGADETLSRCVDLLRQSDGTSKGPHLARVLAGLGRVRQLRERPAEAEACLRESLTLRTASAAHTPEEAESQALLGACLLTQGRIDEAERLLLDAATTAERDDRPSEWRQLTFASLAEIFETRGDPAAAQRWRDRATAKPAGR